MPNQEDPKQEYQQTRKNLLSELRNLIKKHPNSRELTHSGENILLKDMFDQDLEVKQQYKPMIEKKVSALLKVNRMLKKLK